MKRLLFLFLLFCSSAWAVAPQPEEKVNFFFESIQLNELARVMYVDMMGKSYVFDSDFLHDKTEVGFTFRQITKSHALKAMESLLEAHGLTVKFEKGVYFVKKKSPIVPDAEEVFLYRPKFRSVSYITDLTASLFDKGRFSFQRPIKPAGMSAKGVDAVISGIGGQQGQNQASAQSGHGQPSKFQDSGTSAFSSISKEVDLLIFQGTEKEIAKLQKLLVQIDIPEGQLVVRAHVYEVTTGAREGSALAIALNLVTLTGMQNSGGVTNWKYKIGDMGTNLGNLVAWKNSTIEGIFTAFAHDSRFKVVSSPSLRVKHGNTARFSVGQDVPVMGNVQLDKNGNPVQSVEYKPSGVILDIQPRIMDERIELTINQQLSSFHQTTTGVNNSPTLNKREIKTVIDVDDGDVIVLGGLDESTNSGDSTGLPYVPRFLRANGQEDSKTELLMVLDVQKI